jgi:hypothetical protein
MRRSIFILTSFFAIGFASAETLVRVLNLNGNAQVKFTAYNAANGSIDLQTLTTLTNRTSEIQKLSLASGQYHLEISSNRYRSKIITFHTDDCLPPRNIEIAMTTDIGAKIALANVFGPETIELICN